MKLSPALSSLFRHPKTKEVLGLLVMAFALLLLVSLLSFSPKDPSFFHYDSRGGAVRNFGGLVGAHLAGDLFRILGVVAFLLPLALFWVGFSLMSRRRLQARTFRVVGFLLLLGSTCLLLSLLEQEGFLPAFRGEHPGGFVALRFIPGNADRDAPFYGPGLPGNVHRAHPLPPGDLCMARPASRHDGPLYPDMVPRKPSGKGAGLSAGQTAPGEARSDDTSGRGSRSCPRGMDGGPGDPEGHRRT